MSTYRTIFTKTDAFTIIVFSIESGENNKQNEMKKLNYYFF